MQDPNSFNISPITKGHNMLSSSNRQLNIDSITKGASNMPSSNKNRLAYQTQGLKNSSQDQNQSSAADPEMNSIYARISNLRKNLNNNFMTPGDSRMAEAQRFHKSGTDDRGLGTNARISSSLIYSSVSNGLNYSNTVHRHGLLSEQRELPIQANIHSTNQLYSYEDGRMLI